MTQSICSLFLKRKKIIPDLKLEVGSWNPHQPHPFTKPQYQSKSYRQDFLAAIFHEKVLEQILPIEMDKKKDCIISLTASQVAVDMYDISFVMQSFDMQNKRLSVSRRFNMKLLRKGWVP